MHKQTRKAMNNLIDYKQVFPLSFLPNKDGFKFIAIKKDGNMFIDTVTNVNGVHKISDFKNTIAWKRK